MVWTLLLQYALFDEKFLGPARFLKKVFCSDFFKPCIPCRCKSNNIEVDFILYTRFIPTYFPVWESPGVWKHQTQPTVFTLCVYYFGIKYNSTEYAPHLINVIRKYFKSSIYWEGQNYLGLTLDWNYTKNYVDISIPGYIPTAFHKFQHKPPACPQL